MCPNLRDGGGRSTHRRHQHAKIRAWELDASLFISLWKKKNLKKKAKEVCDVKYRRVQCSLDDNKISLTSYKIA